MILFSKNHSIQKNDPKRVRTRYKKNRNGGEKVNKPKLIKERKMVVPWSDCDAAGISYFPRNFEWYTNSYLEWLDHYGFSYMETFHEKGIAVVCLKADSEYKQMVKPMEEITIYTTLTSLTKTRLQFTYQVFKKNDVLAATGFTNHAFVKQNGKPVNLEKELPTVWKDLHHIYDSASGEVN